MGNIKNSNRDHPTGTANKTLRPVLTANSYGITAGQSLAAASAKTHVINGTGAPGSVGQVSGDFFFRTDTPTVALQRLYYWDGATWIAVL